MKDIAPAYQRDGLVRVQTSGDALARVGPIKQALAGMHCTLFGAEQTAATVGAIVSKLYVESTYLPK